MFFKINQVFVMNKSYKVPFLKSTLKSTTKHLCTAPSIAQNLLNFTDHETDKILETINTKPMEQLACYDISKAKLNKIDAWKLKNGHFNNINDILQVDGFSVKIAEKFCKSLLGDIPEKKSPRKAAPFVTPLISEAQIREINSSVSINIGVSSVTWSRLELNKDGPCELTHWQRHDINEKKLHLGELISRCLYVNFLIPEADCYVLENPQVAQSVAPGNAEQVNINVQRAQLTAILGYALASRNTSTDRSKPNVFYLKRFLAARLFQQLVGTERISAEKTVLSLMRTYYNIDDMADSEENTEVGSEMFSSRGNVCFPNDLRVMYKDAERYGREFLGQTLLLNLAFVRLVLIKDAQSRALVARNSKGSE